MTDNNAADNDARKVAFLKDLTALSRKHGLIIWGCGCCGSPSLNDLDEKDAGEYLMNNHYHGPEIEWKEKVKP
jgi:hypothetical protein